MIYTVYMKSDARPLAGDETGETLFDSLQAVPEKNANWALVFPPFWLAYHRLWFALAIYGLVAVLLFSLLATPLAWGALMLMGLPGIYLLFEGNQLRRNKLEADGFELVDVVYAQNEEFALEKFLENWKAPSEKSSSVSSRPLIQQDAPSFGMFPQGEM
jgi:hypothetical protein